VSESALSYLFQEDLYVVPQKVTVVLAKPWNDYTLEQRTLLSKILASVKLSLSAVQILTADSFDLKLIPAGSASRILIFGSATPPSITAYQPNQAQGFSVIKADDLAELDDQKKKNLWTALKAMFEL
jgi:DNA polymerase III psi subunit